MTELLAFTVLLLQVSMTFNWKLNLPVMADEPPGVSRPQ